jgi:transposase
LEKRRRRAIAMLRGGAAPVEVARQLGVDRRSVRRWRASYEERGPTGLKANPTPGRPPKLDADAFRRLEDLLLQGPRACGFATDLWTCPGVAELIRREFHVRYHVAHIGRLLRGLGWTPQKPIREGFSKREFQVAQMVALGYAPKQIAADLGIATNTVRNHIKSAACMIPGRGWPLHRLTRYWFDNNLHRLNPKEAQSPAE